MSDALSMLQRLIARPSITPDDAGCQALIAEWLRPLGFCAESLPFGDTQNTWYRRGQSAPLLVFLGHTDVVPPGPIEAWDAPPFEPTLRDGFLYGRGAADMKSGIACFIEACHRFIADHPNHLGSLALLLTSDEEGPATHGTVKVIETLQQRSERIDWCVVGEPSSEARTGDVLRIGRRGSLNATLTVYGRQGHVAYPERADNPIHRFAPALQTLVEEVWDEGDDYFPPTRLQIANLQAGLGADNVIPGQLALTCNWRFSPALTPAVIEQRLRALLDAHGLRYDVAWRLSGLPFLTRDGALVAAATHAVHEVTGYAPRCDTGGGTSDGRFVAPTGAEVVELGSCNATIHQINERIALDELKLLPEIYYRLLCRLLT